MYDAHSSSAATAHYSDAKEAFHDAISAARELELPDEMAALQARLDHIKGVFRSQFSRAAAGYLDSLSRSLRRSSLQSAFFAFHRVPDHRHVRFHLLNLMHT